MQTFLQKKRDGCHEKLDDAKQLKDGIDHRGHQVASYLRQYLTTDEFQDYEFFVKIKSKLNMDLQEIEEKIKMGDEQLAALKKSIKGGGGGESAC